MSFDQRPRWLITLYITSGQAVDIHSSPRLELKKTVCGPSLAHLGSHKPEQKRFRFDHSGKPWSEDKSPQEWQVSGARRLVWVMSEG